MLKDKLIVALLISFFYFHISTDAGFSFSGDGTTEIYFRKKEVPEVVTNGYMGLLLAVFADKQQIAKLFTKSE